MLPQNLADGKTIRQLIPANSITRFQLLMKIPLTILFHWLPVRITTKSNRYLLRNISSHISVVKSLHIFQNDLINDHS